MKKLLLVFLLMKTSCVLFAQDETDEDVRPKFIKISATVQPEKDDPNLKSTPQINMSAIVIKSGAFVSAEHFKGNYSMTLGVGGVFHKTTAAMGINVAMTPIASDKNRKVMLVGGGLLLNHTAKDLEIEIRSRYDTKLVHTSKDWQQHIFAVSFESIFLRSKKIRFGFAIEYFKEKSKEPTEFSGSYTVFDDMYTQYADLTYTERRQKYKVFLNFSLNKHIELYAGPVISESEDKSHIGLSMGLQNAFELWNYTTGFTKVILRF